MPSGDHLTVGTEGRAERVECRHRDDTVVVAPQDQRRQATGRQRRHLVAEIGGHGDAARVDHRQGVAEDVLDEHPGDQPGSRTRGVGERELHHRIHQRSNVDGAREQVADDRPRIADRVEYHEVPSHLAVIVRELRRHAATETVTQDDHRIAHADHRDEFGHPVGVAGQRPLLPRQRSSATEAGERRCDHPAPAGGEPAQRTLIGAVVEPPPVQEQHGEPSTAGRIHRGPPVDVDSLGHHLVDMPPRTDIRRQVGDHVCDIPHRRPP